MRLQLRREWGVRRTAVLAAVLTTTMTLVAGAVLLLLFLQRSVIGNAQDRATNTAKILAANYTKDAISPGRLPRSGISTKGLLVEILDSNGFVIASSDTDIDHKHNPMYAPAPGKTIVERDSVLATVGDFDNTLIAVTGFVANGQNYAVSVEVPLANELATVRNVGIYILAAGPVIVILSALGTIFLVNRALRPVRTVRDQVELISRERLSDRVHVPQTKDDIADLATTMNSMLERLEDADIKQRQFVSDASHELRSPLASIGAAVEVVNDEDQSPAWQDMGPVIASETARLQSLVENLLALAKGDDQSDLTETHPCDLDDLLGDEVLILRTKSAHRVVVHLDPVQVRCDRGRISQVIRNLLDNADRHAIKQVTVSLSSSDGDAIIWIDNDGPPIPEADRERVFDRFVRLESSRARTLGSSGLGLAIVRDFTTAHGGAVRTSATADGNCRFEVRLPISEDLLPIVKT
ncbi:MAG: HAMP domain-containing sensor histidine kinase [Antricoccus sp.]